MTRVNMAHAIGRGEFKALPGTTHVRQASATSPSPDGGGEDAVRVELVITATVTRETWEYLNR